MTAEHYIKLHILDTTSNDNDKQRTVRKKKAI